MTTTKKPGETTLHLRVVRVTPSVKLKQKLPTHEERLAILAAWLRAS